MKAIKTLLFLCFISVAAFAQEKPTTRILFIYDASNSMNGQWESGVKNTIAQRLLFRTVDSLQTKPQVQLALRVYGHQKYYQNGQDCDDTKLEVPFAKGNHAQIKKTLLGLKPKGTTPIAATLEKSAGDFPPCDNCRNIIILITDGIEECNGDPCAMSLALQKKGIVLKPFVIGIGLDLKFKKSFECIGTYYDAVDEGRFEEILNVVISQALNSTTAQVNLLDIKQNPTETNVPYTLYNSNTEQVTNNFVHTLNAFGRPDTLRLDPVINYELQVHTVPEVLVDSITLTAGEHNIIGASTPQGKLLLKMNGMTGDRREVKAILRKAGEMKTINVQGFNYEHDYLIGDYDLEVLTLPRIYLDKVNVAQSHTTTVQIQQPGVASISKPTSGYGAVFIRRADRMEWVYNLGPKSGKETVYLQPGDYTVVYRTKASRATSFTTTKDFKVSSGASVVVQLF